jgi:acyl carrier protein
MTAPEQVLARVFNVPAQDLRDDSSPDTIATWDSLAHMMMIVELEREYGISVAPADALDAKTVAAVKQLLTTYGVSW